MILIALLLKWERSYRAFSDVQSMGSEIQLLWFTAWNWGRSPFSVCSSLVGGDRSTCFIRSMRGLNENKKSLGEYVAHCHHSVNFALLVSHRTILTYDQLLLIWIISQKISSILYASHEASNPMKRERSMDKSRNRKLYHLLPSQCLSMRCVSETLLALYI